MIPQGKLLLRSFLYYWKSHLLVSLGAAISTMVLTGALIIGDSVKTSLLTIAQLRLGRTEYVFQGTDRYFRSELAYELQSDLDTDVAPALKVTGIASSQGGAMKANGVNIWGVDENFTKMTENGAWQNIPGNAEVFISANLASRLQLKTGDPVLLRLEKASPLPKNAPFVSETDNFVTTRLTVRQILGPDQLGQFNLMASQTAPFNAFISLKALNEIMGTGELANLLLFASNNKLDIPSIMRSVGEHWTVRDAGLSIGAVDNEKKWEIKSERVFIEPAVVEAVKELEPEPELILTYFANNLKKGPQSTPYSFVSAISFKDKAIGIQGHEVLINEWLAEDLHAGIGDSIRMDYFVIGPLRKLEEKSIWLSVKDVVPLNSPYDQSLMPTIPGLTDAGNCRDWETGIPIDLDKIREKDEAYWNEWHGTPKAFIAYNLGKLHWENRFGVSTAMRLSSEKYSRESIEQYLGHALNPSEFGFGVDAVMKEGFNAAKNGVDFSQLFIGLSFFILLAGLSLLALLFNLHIEKRISEAGTLRALGYADRTIQWLYILEGAIIAIPGVILGGVGSILYNHAVFSALQTVWQDIVRTSVLQVDIRMGTLLMGMSISLLLAVFTIWINVRRKLKATATQLQKGLPGKNSSRSLKWLKPAGLISTLGVAILLSVHLLKGNALDTAIFFVAGGVLLVAFLLLSASFTLNNKKNKYSDFSVRALALENIHRNGPRSLRIIILFALGTFVVLTTGLNRKDLHSGALDKKSGTGGFLFYGETTIPILADLNNKDVRSQKALDIPLNFVQIRKTNGDDASCLNLNRVTQPRILGLRSEDLEGRFTFVKKAADLDPEKPWKSLKNRLPGGFIPAIADQTVIQWGLGKKVGDTLVYRNELGRDFTIKLVGGIANSIFQGNILIDESHFLEQFPFSSGTHVFLSEGPFENRKELKEILERVFRNEGLDLEYTADRLATFNRIEDTYLSIFLLLGGLGMILGAVGLGITLARNILDRRKELAIMKIMGYKTKTIIGMLTGEHMVLLGMGTIAGAITAAIATLPSVLASYAETSWLTALMIILFILLNGMMWVMIIANSYLKRNLLDALRAE